MAEGVIEMASKKIKVTTNESCDWTILEYDGCYEASGHSLSNRDWIKLLEYLGYEVEQVQISDEEMENM